jgi:FkbM family methyltransferase
MRILQPAMTFEVLCNKHLPSLKRGRFIGSRIIRFGMNHLGLQPPVVQGPHGVQFEYAPGFIFGVVMSDLVYRGRFEESETETLRGLTAHDDVMIDVGANLGYFALMASRWVGPRGRVFAFEPVRETAAQLRRNIALNDAKNIEVLDCACGAEPGEMSMVTDEYDSGLAYLSPVVQGNDLVKVIRLDDFVRERGLSRVDVLKIDAEGADLEVAKGARETIERFRPAVWLETFWLDRFGATEADVSSYFEPLGYECTPIKNEESTDMLCLPMN